MQETDPRQRRLQESSLVPGRNGERGGARIIYSLAEDGTIWLLIVYTKAKFDNLPTSFLAEMKKRVENVD